jgi:hypothetical protein
MVKIDQAPLARACNPSYLGGRDQKDPVQGQLW